MARKLRMQSPIGFYHIIQRGNGGQLLFENNRDFQHYIQLLSRFLTKFQCHLIAYCLMDNHVHLLLQSKDKPSRFMHSLGTAYARYFNDKYHRFGHLFHDRYSSFPLKDQEAIIRTAHYIHNNPEAAGICAAGKYRWSSYREYTAPTGKPGVASVSLLLSLLGGKEQFVRKCAEALENPGEVDDIRKPRLSDIAAMKIIRDLLHIHRLKIAALPKEKRDHAILLLLQKGLSIRQTERLTGISKGVVQRIRWSGQGV